MTRCSNLLISAKPLDISSFMSVSISKISAVALSGLDSCQCNPTTQLFSDSLFHCRFPIVTFHALFLTVLTGFRLVAFCLQLPTTVASLKTRFSRMEAMTNRGNPHLRRSLSLALSILGLHNRIHRLARGRVTVHRTLILRVVRNWCRGITRRRGAVDGWRGRHRRTVVETHGPSWILGVLGKMWWRRTVWTWREAVCHVASGIRSAKVR